MQRHFSGWENSGAVVDDIWTGSEFKPCGKVTWF
jgi:hypothetical protein